MKFGRLTFNTHHFVRSTLGLCMVTLIAVYGGASVPGDLRRYIVTPQDTTNAEMQAAVDRRTGDSWQSVGAYVVDKEMLSAMDGRERAVIRASFQQEIKKASSEETIRQRIRVPLLPGPVVASAGPTDRIKAPAAAPAPAAPLAQAAAPATNKAPVTDNTPASPLAEDLATIEALKAAFKEAGVHLDGYRNDIADE